MKKKQNKKTTVPFKSRKFGLFGPIFSPEQAMNMIRQASLGCYVVGGIHAVLGIFTDHALVAIGAIYAVWAYLLGRFKSRPVAVGLVLFSGFCLLINEADRHGENYPGQTNIFFSLIVLFIAIRALDAAFKLRGKWKET